MVLDTMSPRRDARCWLSQARRRLIPLVEIVAGMSGVFVSRLTPIRVLVTIAIVGGSLALALSNFRPSRPLVYGSFVALFALRYLFLFWSFTPLGIAARLKACFGPARGFAIYEAITACFFAARSLTFAWLLEATPVPLDTSLRTVLVVLGVIFAVVGTSINVWATSVVGLGTYYYGDLFMGEAPAAFKVEGPYRIWRNPMYGIGQLAAYGAALVALSPLGVLASLLNQGTMYVFNWLVEQPHLNRVQIG